MAEGKGKARRKAPTRGTAPSSGDLDKLEKMEASPEAKSAEPATVDAMGQDKRRQVIGQTYGPTRRSQIIFFAAAAGVVLLLIGGSFAAIAAFDTSPDEYPDKAPWSAANTPQNSTPGYHPRSPSGPCGEPGSPYPQTEGTPCAVEGTSEGQPPGSGRVTNSGGEAN